MSAPRAINAVGEALIQKWEGLSLTAYDDGTGTWTIGYGHTLGVYEGETITLAQANQLLAQDLLLPERAVTLYTTDPPTDNQFAAMVSLSFNIGISGFRTSTVLRQHNAGNHEAAAQAFLLWDKAHIDGQLVTVPGLLNRRIAEAALYQTP